MTGGAAILAALARWTYPPFIAAVALIAIGYTGSVSMVIHVYGKVLELSPDVQGSAVGWLSTWGVLARTIGPVCAAYLLTYTGPRPLILFVVAGGIPATVVLCVVILYQRLPP